MVMHKSGIEQVEAHEPQSSLSGQSGSTRCPSAWAVVGFLFLCVGGAVGQTGLQPHSFEKGITRTVKASYLLYLPQDHAKVKKTWPAILYLHGGTGRGDDIKKIMWYPLPRMLEHEASFPFIAIMPQCPEGKMWTDTGMLIALLDDVAAQYGVDPTRVYLMGYSMGGYGVWNLAYEYPDRFAAIAPMSGRANPWWATRIKDIPIWVFHGGKDDRVPLSETTGMIEALRAEGGTPKLSIDPNRGHSPPSDAEHQAVFAWFLTHQKKVAKR